jgi:uncharacterized RDD family membrane protein YckC
MVYPNISEDIHSETVKKTYYAPAFSRFFSAMLDYFILSPVVAFFIVMFFKDSISIITKSAVGSNVIIIQLAIFSILLFTGLQAVFIYFNRATPGQIFLKLYVSFDQKPSNLFFQIWFRQIGFVSSIIFFGLPFLAVIYHNKHRTFYDRLSECDVMTLVPEEEISSSKNETYPASGFVFYDTDKKYLSASVSALMCFVSLILIFSIIQSHDVLLHKIQVASLNETKEKKCFVIENQNQEERLKTVLALNILNLTSDDCALSEADEVFNKMKIGQKNENDPNNISLAYFVKYYIGQKNVDSGMNQAEYFKYACGHGIKSDLCSVLDERTVASEKTQDLSPQILKNKLLEYIGKNK